MNDEHYPAQLDFTQLNEAISYTIISRKVLKTPPLDPAIKQLAYSSNASDVLNYNQALSEHEIRHAERISSLLNITDNTHIYPIGNKHDQTTNEYARYFNGAIKDISINFRENLLILIIKPDLLPANFTIPEPNEVTINLC